MLAALNDVLYNLHWNWAKNLCELRILGDIVVVSEHGHSLQILCDVVQLFCFSP